MSNIEVLRYWRIMPTHAAVAMRRVRWLQSMTENERAHEQTVAALFGRLAELESEEALDAQGHLTDAAPPEAHAFNASLRLLEGISATEAFFEL